MKLVKQQINGDERVVLKEDASPDDLKIEIARLKSKLGYDVQPDKRRGRYIAKHDFFSGRFMLTLED